jgi:hypothetical protein
MVDEGSILIAERYVAEAHRIIAKQRGSIERLRAAGCSTIDAEQTLSVFESSLHVFAHHCDRLRQDLG